ncbi:hypothetical protein CC86DRAFT_196402 [Ophiobolus disseminans]|uniref:Heterokaryon incompatibility domain-containing protein n=1 Tax=Ophiobolus disseminans TaxID=1469910 RepID=A0A6A7A5U5_9PLEO|nr:hypothetical protein CC86DRAFT_196402 [Ophiobolus disseminans]
MADHNSMSNLTPGRPARGFFQHSPMDLQKNMLRLIEVLPSQSDDPNRLIKCIIRHDTTSAKYTCLSYVWGPARPEELRYILLNGHYSAVLRNLWEFLDVASSHHARDRNVGIEKNERSRFDFESATQSLWVDALCIDQENIPEKDH